ncbi:hypothetical protein OS493_001428 [Desmophyllum pertusum]|uniref:G-protein coupled receptors family 1 profile domain-containing protein n=1 Tax=Desmophyllum pertusum TaxID=174260 RepID=A0A9W9ZGJ5_9CNID|nr:hypothetical protein OS493_001428 [Desmophyllum pertusum]
MGTTFTPSFSSNTSPTWNEDNFPVDYTVVESAFSAAALLIIMITCLMGNAVICYVVFRNRRMWTEMNMFLVNLAIGDIAMTLLSMTSPLETAIIRQWTFGRGPVCQLNAFCNSVLFCNTIFTHTAISVDRFFAVVKPMKKIMTRRKAFYSILGVWMLSVAISLGPILGWGRNDYNGSTLQCGFGFPKNRFESLYIICLAVFVFLLPITIMSYAYIRIYWVVRHHTRRLSTSTFGNYQDAFIKKQQKTVLTFFLALIAFILCWTPFFVFIAIAVSIPSRDKLPRGLGLAAYWCGFLNSAINPYLIGLRSERFHETFVYVFCCCFRCYKRATEQRCEDNYFSDKTFCAETKSCTPSQMTQLRNGHVSSFLNAVDIANVSQQTAVTSSHDKRNDKKARRTGRQENLHEAVYPHFIHMAHGKLWNEATV